MKKAIIALFIILFPVMAWGATYYIDPSQTDPSEDGTEAHPFDSWADVTWAAGNSYLQKRGTIYRTPGAEIQPNVDGTAGAGITIGAYGTGDKPRIYGSFLADGADDWSDAGGNIWVCNDALITADVGNIVAVDSSYTCLAKCALEGDLTAQGEFWYDSANTQVKVYSASNPHTYYGDLEVVVGIARIDIENDYYTIENIDFRYIYMGVQMTGDNITVQDCEAHYIGGYYLSGTTRAGNAFECWMNNSNIVVQRCKIYNTYDAGLTAQASLAAGACTLSNITFRNNYLENCHYSFEFFATHESSVMENIYIYNNTAVNCGSWGSTAAQRSDNYPVHIRIWPIGTATNMVFKNNIFSGQDVVYYMVNTLTPTSGSYSLSYNVFYPDTPGSAAYRFDYSAHTFAEWQAHGFDATGSSEADPLLTGYTISTSSPCIDAGTDVGVSTDILSQLRPSGSGYDIGAYEVQQGTRVGTGVSLGGGVSIQ